VELARGQGLLLGNGLGIGFLDGAKSHYASLALYILLLVLVLSFSLFVCFPVKPPSSQPMSFTFSF